MRRETSISEHHGDRSGLPAPQSQLDPSVDEHLPLAFASPGAAIFDLLPYGVIDDPFGNGFSVPGSIDALSSVSAASNAQSPDDLTVDRATGSVDRRTTSRERLASTVANSVRPTTTFYFYRKNLILIDSYSIDIRFRPEHVPSVAPQGDRRRSVRGWREQRRGQYGYRRAVRRPTASQRLECHRCGDRSGVWRRCGV